MKKTIVTLAALCLFVGSAGAGDLYFDEADFLAAILPNPFLEEFDWLPAGLTDPYTRMDPAGSGWGYYVHAPDTEQGLWVCANPPHGMAMSTNNTYDDVQFDFFPSVEDVLSTGGWFYPSDINCMWNQGQPVTLSWSDGMTYTYTPASITDFVGYVTDVPLDWFRVSAPDDPLLNWVSVDHLYIDSPEPGTLCLLGLGALALFRRR